MLTPEERKALERRVREVETELEQLQDVEATGDEPVDEEIVAREDALRAEQAELETRLRPDAVDRRRHEGRSETDLLD